MQKNSVLFLILRKYGTPNPVYISERPFEKFGEGGEMDPMEDSKIIDLFWNRDEDAIKQTEMKYGAYCHTVAFNILSIKEDAEECVCDTWLSAWNNMPPQRPANLRIWLGKIVRNCALNLWNKNHAKKRYNGMEMLFEELEDCLPSDDYAVQNLEAKELSQLINDWLKTLSESDRALFIRRYWGGESLTSLAKHWHITPAKLAQKMYKLRGELKSVLQKEGVTI